MTHFTSIWAWKGKSLLLLEPRHNCAPEAKLMISGEGTWAVFRGLRV